MHPFGNSRRWGAVLASGIAVAAIAAASASGDPAASSSQTAAPAQPSIADLDPALALDPLPPGYIRKGNQFFYDGGNVIVTPAAVAASKPCNDPWLCLYRDVNWEGTMWQYQEHKWQNLRVFNASDEVSSWSNHESRTATLGWDSIEDGKAPYLDLPPHSHSSSMGSWSDKASSVLP